MAIGCDPQAPSTPGIFFWLGPLADRSIERDPCVALSVELGPVGVFMVIARDTPSPRHRPVGIGLTIAILVGDTRQFRALNRVEGPFMVAQAKGFMEPLRKKSVVCGGWILRLVCDPDLPLA